MLYFDQIQISDRFYIICDTRYMSADVSNLIHENKIN